MKPYACGGRGCLEQYCSATGLLRQAKKALVENPYTVSTMKDIDTLTAKDVCDAAKMGDTLALDLLDSLARRQGWALTAAAGTADPEVFVIGGRIVNQPYRRIFLQCEINEAPLHCFTWQGGAERNRSRQTGPTPIHCRRPSQPRRLQIVAAYLVVLLHVTLDA